MSGDPSCAKVFTLISGPPGRKIARMKRTVSYDRLSFVPDKVNSGLPYEWSIISKFTAPRSSMGFAPEEVIPAMSEEYEGVFVIMKRMSRLPLPGLGSAIERHNGHDKIRFLGYDSSDNVYIERLQETDLELKYTVRTIPLIDHILGYWNFDIPEDLKISDIQLFEHAKKHTVNAFYKNRETIIVYAEKMVGLIGIENRENVYHILSRISKVTRGQFRCKPPLMDQDWMVPTVEKKLGSCRHRAAVAFVVANYLGVPTRYCASDCHAWVEFWIPITIPQEQQIILPNGDTFTPPGKWFAMDLGGCDPGGGERHYDDEEDINPPTDDNSEEEDPNATSTPDWVDEEQRGEERSTEEYIIRRKVTR